MIVLTLLVGNQNYNGTGVNIIAQCIDGTVRPEAFLLKMIFTAATLGAGYKGGEIVPSFFTGAAFGCLFGNLLGFSPALCTAVGMVIETESGGKKTIGIHEIHMEEDAGKLLYSAV